MNKSLFLFAFVFLALVAAAAEARSSSSAATADEDGGQMTDALKYLEQLDKYYSQVARPR